MASWKGTPLADIVRHRLAEVYMGSFFDIVAAAAAGTTVSARVVKIGYGIGNRPDTSKIERTINEWMARGWVLQSQAEQPAGVLRRGIFWAFQGETRLTFIKLPSQNPTTTTPTRNGAYCTKCGVAFSAEDRFCGGCGAPRK